jgi:hypothetical protein
VSNTTALALPYRCSIKCRSEPLSPLRPEFLPS